VRVVYRGPFRAVEVPSLGNAVFERDVPADVPDETGAALVLQEVWDEHKTPKQLAAEAKQAAVDAAAAEQSADNTGTEVS
jgi:hypothetical protein